MARKGLYDHPFLPPAQTSAPATHSALVCEHVRRVLPRAHLSVTPFIPWLPPGWVCQWLQPSQMNPAEEQALPTPQSAASLFSNGSRSFVRHVICLLAHFSHHLPSGEWKVFQLFWSPLYIYSLHGAWDTADTRENLLNKQWHESILN